MRVAVFLVASNPSHGQTAPSDNRQIFVLPRHSPHRVISVLEALLTERKVLLVSSQYAVLGAVGEALRALLYPFHWNFPYIPVMPASAFGYLQMPTPFLLVRGLGCSV